MSALTLTVVCIYLAGQTALTGAGDWSYGGALGPHNWDDMFPEACSGRYQSPIDIITKSTTYDPVLNDFVLWHDPPKVGSKFSVLNNGHSVQVNVFGPYYVANGGLPSVYSTAQFHFHWGHADHQGSEHLLNGQASPIELHVVNYDSDTYAAISDAMVEHQGLAVLGVFFKLSEKDNPVLAPMIEALEMVQDPDTDVEVEIPATRLRDFLPEDTSKYYRYNGSLTTPGCFESVIWTVFEDKQTISMRQLAKFRRVLQRKPRKHGKHLKRSAHRMKRGDEAALDEVGIKGNLGEELELQAVLKRKAQASHDADVPKEGQPVHYQGDGSTPEPHDGHGNTAGSDVDPMEIEIIQEYLVNNFRPVQPIHGRKIYRSFQFDEVVVHLKSGSTRSRNYNSDVDPSGNGGIQMNASFIGFFMSAILFLFRYL